MNKRDLRADMKARRRGVPAEMRERASESICAQLLAKDLPGPVAVYLAGPDEIDLKSFIVGALARGIELLAPRWTGETYELAPLRGFSPEFLRKGPMGIWEPAEEGAAAENGVGATVGAWIVPGLAFTRDGKRLGYGGGWYDRLMAGADAAVPKIAVGYDFQVVDDLPSEPHDIPLTEVVTGA